MNPEDPNFKSDNETPKEMKPIGPPAANGTSNNQVETLSPLDQNTAGKNTEKPVKNKKMILIIIITLVVVVAVIVGFIVYKVLSEPENELFEKEEQKQSQDQKESESFDKEEGQSQGQAQSEQEKKIVARNDGVVDTPCYSFNAPRGWVEPDETVRCEWTDYGHFKDEVAGIIINAHHDINSDFPDREPLWGNYEEFVGNFVDYRTGITTSEIMLDGVRATRIEQDLSGNISTELIIYTKDRGYTTEDGAEFHGLQIKIHSMYTDEGIKQREADIQQLIDTWKWK